MEQPPLHVLQGEDGKVGGNVDRNGIKDRALHLVRGFADGLLDAAAVRARVAEVAEDVFHHTPAGKTYLLTNSTLS